MEENVERNELTHGNILLEMLLAADQVRGLSSDLPRECTSIDLDPLLHFFMGALGAEVAGDCYGEVFEGVFDHGGD